MHANWKAFYFTDVFTEIKRGKRLKKSDHEEGSTPYVSSTSFNNGVDGFIGNDGGVRKFSDCLTLANSGSVGSTFYHHYEFIASDHVTQLKRDGLDKYAYLFMIPLINRLSEKYSFNREINDERIKREKFLLPVTENNDIDFAFMSLFMKQIEEDILGTTLSVFKERLKDNLLNCSDLQTGGVNWKTFKVEEILNIENCKCSKVSALSDGEMPYIGATTNNNGVCRFVEKNDKYITKGNCIVFVCDGEGSIGLSIYKHEDFIGSTTLKVGRCEQLNKYNAMFITTVADTVRGKYNFGYKRNEKNLKRETITLPVTPTGHPDWEFMENYMRHQESKQILQYLSKHF